jgi:hypothetical protein
MSKIEKLDDKLIDVWFEKIKLLEENYHNRFCFEYDSSIYISEWKNNKWQEPCYLLKM